jgi:hypothetical protein
MCSKDLYYQEFVIEGLELQKYKHEFLKKVGQYYKMQDEVIIDKK